MKVTKFKWAGVLAVTGVMLSSITGLEASKARNHGNRMRSEAARQAGQDAAAMKKAEKLAQDMVPTGVDHSDLNQAETAGYCSVPAFNPGGSLAGNDALVLGQQMQDAAFGFLSAVSQELAQVLVTVKSGADAQLRNGAAVLAGAMRSAVTQMKAAGLVAFDSAMSFADQLSAAKKHPAFQSFVTRILGKQNIAKEDVDAVFTACRI